jgi:VWFA-related protein
MFGERMVPNRNNFFLPLVFVAVCAAQSSQTPDASMQDVFNKRVDAERQEQDVRRKIRVRSDLVVLSITVRDKTGNLVSGLTQDDFRVFDDEAEQKITAFSAEGLPLSLVILVDSDAKWKDETEMAKSLRAITGGLSVVDEAMVCHYDMLFYPGDKFTSVSGNLIDQLKATQAAVAPSPQYLPPPVVTDAASTTGPPPIAAPIHAGSRPSKAMDDAIYSAAELLQDRGSDRRKVILIVSDGLNEPKLNHHTHQEVEERLLRKNVSVYSLAVVSGSRKRQASMLADYAMATGGDIFYANKSSAMENLYSRITEQVRYHYTVAYAPIANAQDRNFHTVRVTARAGLTASTRRGYYTNDSHVIEH